MKLKKIKFTQKLLKILVSLLPFYGILANAQTVIDSNKEGPHEDLVYMFWQDDGGSSITLYEGGRYTSNLFSNTNNAIGGLGWNPGGPRIVNFSGTYTPAADANSYLALYGWILTEDIYYEYFIVESWGTWNPAQTGEYYGTYTSDGNTYDLYHYYHPPKGIDPITRITLYSVRQNKLPHGTVSGIINSGKHFNAWKNMGIKQGEMDYMIMATESYRSNVTSDITVSEITPGCGMENSLPICCSVNADEDGDGYGIQFEGEMCIVTPESDGWHPANPDNIIAAVNVGAHYDAVEYQGLWFEPHKHVSNAIRRATNESIIETSPFGETTPASNSVLSSFGLGDMSIDIPVENTQKVSVELGFIEPVYSEINKRVFDIEIEGQVVHSNLDLFEESGQFHVWKPSVFEVDVEDGVLNIQLSASEGEAILSYVIVKKAGAIDTPETPNTARAGSLNLSFLLTIIVMILLFKVRRNQGVITKGINLGELK